jgi:hypothetical protein
MEDADQPPRQEVRPSVAVASLADVTIRARFDAGPGKDWDIGKIVGAC